MNFKFRVQYFYIPFILIVFAIIIVPFGEVLKGVVEHYDKYIWLLLGVIAYVAFRQIPLYKKNEKWFQTTSHELTHAVVGIMFFHKIHSMESKEGEGSVSHSGSRVGDIFIGLSPYCLPIFTFLLLLLRLLGSDSSLFVFDIFIGFTLAFHLHTFIVQTRPSQPDIASRGVVVSYLFIFTALVLNLSVILVTVMHGLLGAVAHLAVRYWDTILFFL